MAGAYAAAFEAASPGEAQSLGAQAQAEIDAATNWLDASEREQEIGERLAAATSHEFVKTAIDVLSRLHPEQNLLEIDAEFRNHLSKRLDREVAAGQGINYAIAEILAKSTLNAERFRSVVTSASKLFDSSEKLRAIAGEPGAVSTLLRARNAIVESTGAFAAAVSTSTTDDARLRRVVNLYRELFEDAGAPLFAWFLRISGAKSAPISKLMREDSTTLLKAIDARRDLAAIFVGADRNIRTAASHGLGYELVGDDVVFNLRSFEGTMTVEVILDLLLALVESLLAAFWVLDNELSIAGVEGHTSVSSLMGASLIALAEEVLRILGASVLSSDETGNSWRFVLGPNRRSDPFIFATALAANPPRNVRELSIVCPDLPTGELRIPREASQRFARTSSLPPLELIAANLIFLKDSTLDGRTALAPDHLRRTACVAALALLHQDQLQAVALLRQCTRFARELSANDVMTFCEAALAEWRHSDPIRLHELKKTMLAWNRLPDPKQPAVRVTTLFDIRP